jgi:hypothetical protein
MKTFIINATSAGRKLTLPVQFMKFGVEDQEIIVPIRKRDKETTIKAPSPPERTELRKSASADPSQPPRSSGSASVNEPTNS